jgi:hypothetical protein
VIEVEMRTFTLPWPSCNGLCSNGVVWVVERIQSELGQYDPAGIPHRPQTAQTQRSDGYLQQVAQKSDSSSGMA